VSEILHWVGDRSILLVYAYTLMFSGVVAMLLVPWCIKAARKFNVLDFPDDRKMHAIPTPLLGGLAMVGAFGITLVVNVLAVRWGIANLSLLQWLPDNMAPAFEGAMSSERLLQAVVIFGGALLVAGVGLLDDLYQVRPRYRLMVQIFAASMVVAVGVSPDYLGMPYWMSALLTVGWIVVVTNSFNLIDSLDGLSAGIAVICAMTLAATMHFARQPLVATFALVVAGCALGFLRYNRSPARIFMGSTGSLFLGFAVSVAVALGISITPTQSPLVSVAMPFLILGVPLYDTLSVVYLRIRAGQHIFEPDQRHLAHRMMKFGFNHREAVWVVYLMTVVVGATSPMLVRATSGETLLLIFQAGCALALVVALEWGSTKNGFGYTVARQTEDASTNRIGTPPREIAASQVNITTRT